MVKMMRMGAGALAFAALESFGDVNDTMKSADSSSVRILLFLYIFSHNSA
jgi:hypothetical protein